MQITLSPVRMDDTLSVLVKGEVLVVNGRQHDFSKLAEARSRDVDDAWFLGPVSRVDGRIRLTLCLPHGASAPAETLFPAPILDPPDGMLALPPAHAPDSGVEAEAEARIGAEIKAEARREADVMSGARPDPGSAAEIGTSTRTGPEAG